MMLAKSAVRRAAGRSLFMGSSRVWTTSSNTNTSVCMNRWLATVPTEGEEPEAPQAPEPTKPPLVETKAPKAPHTPNELKNNLKPSEIVKSLDMHIVGQKDAKKAVAIAMRNRWRRRQLPEELRKEVTPRNVLLVGPTGKFLLRLNFGVSLYQGSVSNFFFFCVQVVARLKLLEEWP